MIAGTKLAYTGECKECAARNFFLLAVGLSMDAFAVSV